MTNEEARKRLLDWIQYATDPERVPFMDEPCSDEEIILAMRIGADALSQPSLPSNIDEAAEEYSRGLDYYHYTGDDPSIAFRAGAEWMAGQGYVDTHAVINEYEKWGDGFAKLELGINEDDDFFEDWQEQNEIIVQIRKKQ